jgi:thioredoxin-dependent peroxiredoxin
VIGCSPDTVEAQAAFKEKYQLPFTLLADPEHQIAEAFGVWALKQRPSGEEYWGVVRTTYIIGPDGAISHAFHQVDPATHAQELLQTLGQR